MARPRKVVHVPPAEAVFILEALMSDGRIDRQTLEALRARYREEISSLEARIAHLRELSGVPVVRTPAPVTAPTVAAAAKRGRRKAGRAAKKAGTTASAKVSPARTKIRALQGRYLGLMHGIPKRIMKQKFGKDAIAKKGKETIVDEMERFLAKRK